MKFKNLILWTAALLGVAVSCDNGVEADPAVKLISPAVVDVEQGGGDVNVVFTSAAEWSLRGLDDIDWVSASAESGKGSADEQSVVLSLTPNEDKDRSVSVTIYSSPLAKKTVTISQAGAKGDGVETITVADFLSKKDTETAYKLTGKIGNISKSEKYYGIYIKDETGEVCVPFPENWDAFKDLIRTGDEISATGKYSYYDAKSQDQVKNGTLSDHTPVDAASVQKLSVKEFVDKADAYSIYRLEGTVTGTVNATYCSFDLKDDSGTVKVYTVNNASEWSSTVKTGGTVVLTGAYTLYDNGTTSTAEVIDAIIESFTPGDDTGGGSEPAVEPITVTVAEFNAAAESSTQPYKLTGTVNGSINTTYGNFDLTDATGTVYVYGLTSTNLGYGAKNDQSYAGLNIKQGDVVTVIGYRGSYNGKIELMYAYYVSHMQGSGNYLNVSTSVLTIDSDDTSAKFNIYSGAGWRVASDNAAVTVSPASGTGDGEVTVSVASANTGDADVTATITVTSDVASVDAKTISFTQKKPAPAGVIVFNATKDKVASTAAGNYSLTKNGVTIAVSNGLLGGAASATGADSNQYRVYKNSTLTISSASKNIKNIEMECTAADANEFGPGCFATQTGYSYSGKFGTWTGQSKSVVFTAETKQVRPILITVTLAD